MGTPNSSSDPDSGRGGSGSVLEVFTTMARLGCIAFGGPVAHLAYFQKELVEKRQWVDEHRYADLIAFCQFLPGPASSQVGMGLGLMRAGLPGMFAAWFAFTMPSAILLVLAAGGIASIGVSGAGWLQGLLAAVVAIVAHAVVGLGRKCCPDAARIIMAVAAAVLLLWIPGEWAVVAQLAVIALGGVIGMALLQAPKPPGPEGGESSGGMPFGRGTMLVGWAILLLLVLVPVGLSWMDGGAGSPDPLAVYGSFAQTGALVFGGGHVVLPMLQQEVVPPGWVGSQQFLAGYGLTQAVPGPIFTFSANLGANIGANLSGAAWSPAFFGYAGLALLGIFMPSFGFVAAWLPLWHRLRAFTSARKALAGINAAVIGLLVAALYDPVWTKAVPAAAHPERAVAVVLVSWLLLVVWKVPPWAVVGLSAVAGWVVL